MSGFDEVFTATGSALDSMLQHKAIHRVALGSDQLIKPNDNCYWDSERDLWMEDDKTFRARIAVETDR